MAVKLVVFDCDRTLWDHHDVSAMEGPFRRVDENAVEDARGDCVRLFPETREVLGALRARGILTSTASWNRPEPVFAIFELLRLTPTARPTLYPLRGLRRWPEWSAGIWQDMRAVHKLGA